MLGLSTLTFSAIYIFRMKKKLLLLTLFTVPLFNTLKAQVTQNFNHNSTATANASCWDLSNGVSIRGTGGDAINTGVDEPFLRTNNLNNQTYSLKTPFVKFNGTGIIAFNHKLHNTNMGTVRELQVKILDQSGNTVNTPFTYDYVAAATPTTTQAEAVTVAWSGIYQVEFEWTGSGGAARGVIDDISIHGSYASDSSLNNNGVCPAMSIPTDTICSSYADQEYKIYNPVSGSNYSWFISNPAAGTIDNSITADNSTIQIDWSGTSGLYTLNVYETSSTGCIGDTVQMDVIVDTLPTVDVIINPVCAGSAPTATFTFTGTAPWVVSYTDGTTTYTDTVASSPFVKTLPAYVSSQTLTVLSLDQNTACSADPASLPSVPIVINPKPSTGLIFHQ